MPATRFRFPTRSRNKNRLGPTCSSFTEATSFQKESYLYHSFCFIQNRFEIAIHGKFSPLCLTEDRLVCSWYSLSKDPRVWRNLYETFFGSSEYSLHSMNPPNPAAGSSLSESPLQAGVSAVGASSNFTPTATPQDTYVFNAAPRAPVNWEAFFCRLHRHYKRAGNAQKQLIWAIQGHHFELSKRLILEKGASAEPQKNKGKDIPLYVAAQVGCKAIALFLVSRGANVNIQSADGSTPMYIAAQNGNKDVAEVLLNAGANIECTFRYDKNFRPKFREILFSDILL